MLEISQITVVRNYIWLMIWHDDSLGEQQHRRHDSKSDLELSFDLHI